MINKKLVYYILSALGLFVLSAGLTYGLVRILNRKPQNIVSPEGKGGVNTAVSKVKKLKFDPSIPLTASCPLNGQMYPASYEEIWKTRRPLAVMIENHLDSRPLSGLSYADIVYEAVAEGGITRQMGLFLCDIAGQNITLAPVRSARIYFTKIVTEYDALYNHVGGAGNCDDPTVDERAKALCFIRRNKIKDMDQFGLDFKACHRLTNRLDHEVAYEHTMGCFTEELYKVATKRDWQNDGEWEKSYVSWKFKDPATDSGLVSDISFDFWKSKADYSVAWKYDKTNNGYSRTNGGVAVTDLNTDDPIMAKNVVVQFVRETGPLDEHLHMDYQVIGTGKAIVFQDGKAILGTWSRATQGSRTKFMAEGKEIQFNKGQIWIELVPDGNIVEYNK